MSDRNQQLDNLIDATMTDATKVFLQNKAIPIFFLGVKSDGQAIHTRDTVFPVDKLIYLLRNLAMELELNK